MRAEEFDIPPSVSLYYIPETFVTVGCLDCPARQVLEYKGQPEAKQDVALRAGLIAAQQCALIKAELPEGDMPPYMIVQQVTAKIKVDGAGLPGVTGYLTGLGEPADSADPVSCPTKCTERVTEVADSIRSAIETA